MSKFTTRAIKYGYIKRTRGKAAAERYMESCFAYDSMRAVGIKGSAAWIIRQEQLRKRRERRNNNIRHEVCDTHREGHFWRPLACWAALIFLGAHSLWLAAGFILILATMPSKNTKKQTISNQKIS